MGKPVLTLRIRGETLVREFESWDELVEAKDKLKTAGGRGLTFNSADKSWSVSGIIKDVEAFAKAVSEVFRVDHGRVVGLLEEHNRSYIRRQLVWASIGRLRGREGEWVKLSFSSRDLYWMVHDRIVGEHDAWIPYNIEVFREGRVSYETVMIRVVRRDSRHLKLFLAPYLYARLAYRERVFEKLGVSVEESFERPSYDPVLDVPDVYGELRPYQREALDRWVENGCMGVVQMPTGGGKTWVGLAAMSRLRVRTVIFVPDSAKA